MNIDRLKRKLEKLIARRDQLMIEHQGNELKFTYWGGYAMGNVKGKIDIIEDILDEYNEEQKQ